MTEEEWLACTDPQPMLEYVRGGATDRKLRLFACGCCRPKWDLLSETSRAAVVVAEKFADGETTRQAMKKARRAAWDGWRFPMLLAACHAADLWAWQGACAAADSAAPRLGTDRDVAGMRSQCDLLRCVLGNPFRPVTAEARWLTSTAVGLAQTIYVERAFDRLPILADALEEAGCDDPDVLSHLRGDGPHVRGCWVVDLVLGKG